MKSNTKVDNAAGKNGVTRREFVKTTGKASLAAGAAGVGLGLYGGKAPAYAQSRELHILEWSSFIKDADVETDHQAAEFGKMEGIKVRVEHINANGMNARATAAVESNTGPDILRLLNNQPHLYSAGLINHDKLVAELGGDNIWGFLRDSTQVDGVYRGVPAFATGGAWAYRTDIFEKAGIRPPNTWDEFMRDGPKLKEIDYPVGQCLGHSFGDPNGFAYTFLWAMGGTVTDESGKNVTINSKATRDSVDFLKEFWFKACDETGLSWDDGSNNRAYLGDQISTTLNGASIYFVARRDPSKSVIPDIADRTRHFINPEGPGGRYHTFTSFSSCIGKYSKVQSAAENYIRFIQAKKQFGKFITINNGYVKGITPDWQKDPIWTSDPALTPFRDQAQYGKTFGYPGPYNRESSELLAKYIVVDLYARAVKGMSADETVRQAEAELKQIYG